MRREQEPTARPVLSPNGRWGEYTQLSRQIKQAGLLDRRRGWYGARIGLNLALLAAGWAAFAVIGESWWQLLVAAYLAVVATQIAFIGHDAGHRQIFGSRHANDLAGLAHANLLSGVSFDWWVAKHNRHHSNPNHEDLDPDISITALAFTPGQASSRHGLVRLLARHQAWLFFPLLLLEAAHLHLASIKAILGDSWWQLLVAAYLAVVATQLAFIGHDAGHRQIFRSRRANDLAGLLHANLGVGMSFDWWVAKHNRHHSNPNHEDLDPDISITALAFTADPASAKHGLVRLMARHQGWLFFPLLPLEAAQLHVASVKVVLRGGTDWAKVVEALLLLLHLAGYVTALVLVLSPLQAVVFIVVQRGLFGPYLGCSFAPNHKGMPTLSYADQLDFVRRQVLTSRNVRGSRLVDFVLGGLNYQIEHHLFPNMPRPNLRHAQPLIRAFCQQRGIGYREASLLGSYAEAVRHLHTIGAPLRPAQAAAD
jgi:fatty acid desaturase